ncbi:MAG: DUF262 domain-containing protein [Fusobacteriaceae bacterium]
MKCYIFRIDRNDFVLKELEQGRLRQGWGVSNMSLLDGEGQTVSEEKWTENYYWSDDSRERKKSKYNNLKNMLNMEIGDFIIIPRAPKWDSFTIGKVKEKYKFSLDSEDFGHLIELSLDSLTTYEYGLNETVKEITSKFRSYQSPVNNVYNGGLIESLKKLVEKSFKEDESIQDYEDASETFSINSYCLNLKSLEEKKIKLTIPIYQRPYSWGDIQINRFLSGIMESFGELEKNKRRKNMFIGTIQLGSNEEGGFDIIDGQQRLTTLNLLMLYLQDFEGNPKQYFKTDVGGQQENLTNLFQEYIGRDFSSENIDNSNMNIYKSNLKVIAEFIEAGDTLDSFRKELVEHIKNNLKFVVVETKATLTETLNIFDTINTSGMDLNGADVFKIKIYEYMKKSKQAGKEVFNEIDGLYKNVIEENKKYDISVTMGHILELYKDYLIAVNELPISVMKMGTDSFFEKLFDGLIRNKFDSNIFTEENIKKITLSLSDIAVVIKARFLWEEIRKSISIEAEFEEQLIHWSRYGRYFKVIYYTLFKEKNQDPATISLMIKKLCKLFTVYSVVYDKQVNDMMKFMKDIYTDILSEKPLEIIFSEIEEKTRIHPQGGNISQWFSDRINGPLANKTTSKNLLCRIEAMLHEDFDRHSPKILIENYFKEHIDIEHIQAYNDQNNAEEIREIWKDEINSIGNLMILESSINKSIGNNHFSNKKQNYKKSKYQIVKNISTLNEWTKEDAEKRRAEAVKRISDYIYSDL